MKANTLLLIICASALISCYKESLSEDKTNTTIVSAPDSDCFISVEQIKSYIARTRPDTKNGGELDYTIKPYGGSADNPLLYIVNYGESNGWQILSSDSRTPAIVAEGETGYFSLEEGSPAVQVWLDCMATDMANVRCAGDEDLVFTAEEIAAHKSVWGARPGVRVLPGDENGHWEVTTTTEWCLAEEIEHMTPHWAQGEPYNTYCPLKSNSSTERAPAGCVAIAAAEVLYYLHNHLGVPASMVDYGYCVGDINNYSRYFSGSSTGIWSQMNYNHQTYGADAEALMIGHIGGIISMNYQNEYAWALPDNIRTNLFPAYGITCSQGAYEQNYVRNNLGNHMPVIVTASDLLIPINFDIHCFVIDGFRKTYTKYIHYHYWVPGEPDPWNPKYPPGFDHNPYYTYTYSTPTVSSIKINWGWASQWGDSPLNDGWYSLIADWVVNDGTSTYSYNHNVNMIYNIAVED
jgi:hypothetical protein